MPWLHQRSIERHELDDLTERLERSRFKRRRALGRLMETLREVRAVKMSPDGLAMLKDFEGCKLTAYRRPGGRADHWLWPYRHRHE